MQIRPRLLLPLVYTHIRPSDDNQHKGAYTPDARDAAEETRAYLLERLFNTPGRATFDALKCLASSNITFSTTERLHILAYRRAAEDAEPAAWDATDIDRFIKIFVRPLHTTEDLFQLVLNRLENCRRDLEGSDFSEAATLQKTQELAIQNWFASRLRDRAQGFYTVSREEEVVDQKKPDIRIHTPSIGSPITIEIKVADKWTYTELSERLENQLIDQYHRDQRSRFGIYLLTYHGDKKYWVARKKHLYFQQLLSELQQQANKIVRGREDVDKIHVFGIDLTTLRK